MKVLDTYFNEKNLQLAWERYKRSKKMVKDVFGFKSFSANIEENIANLSDKLISNKYKPSIPKKYYMPKSSMTQRTQTILNVEDALVYQAIGNIIGMTVYDEISKNYSKFVFSSLLNEEVKYGIDVFSVIEEPKFFFYQWWGHLYKKFSELVNNAIIIDKVKYKFETDITGFFDCIPHFNLFSILENKFKIDINVLDILSICLNTWSGTRDNLTPGVGIPQGPETSYLLANLMLHELDDMFIGEGIKYFRYMDDIHIFGYEEKILQKYLVKIDKFLKSNALSLNAKKTAINPVINDDSETSIIRFQRISLLSDEIIIDLKSKKSNDNKIPSFESEQDGSSILFNNELPKFLTDDELVEYFQNELVSIKAELPKLFEKNNEGVIRVHSEIIQNINSNVKREKEREFLNFAYRFRTAIKELNRYSEVKPDNDLLYYWLCLLETYFWRTDQFCWVLNWYKENENLKSEIFKLFDQFSFYEWIQYNLISTLTITQKFDKQEMHAIYRDYLLKEDSVYTKEAFYKLLIFHCDKDDQFFDSLIHRINQENNIILKRELLYYTLIKKQNLFTYEEIMESFRL